MSYKAVDPVVNGSTAILLDESDGFLGYQDRDGEIKPVLANVGLFANNLITDANGSGFLGVVDPITGKEHWMQNEKDGSKVSFKGPKGEKGDKGDKGDKGETGEKGRPGLTIQGEFSDHPKRAIPQVPSKNVNDAYVLTKTWDTTQGYRRGDVWVFDEKGTAYYQFNCEGPQGEKGAHYINAYYPDQRFESTPSDVVAQCNHKPGDFSISSDTQTIWVYDGDEFISGPSIRGSRLLSYTEKYTVEDILDGPNHANIQREIVSMTGARLGDWIIIYDGSVLKMGETLLSDTGLKMKGADGKDGVDGITPRIGYNGNWFIGEEDTSVKAESTKILVLSDSQINQYIESYGPEALTPDLFATFLKTFSDRFTADPSNPELSSVPNNIGAWAYYCKLQYPNSFLLDKDLFTIELNGTNLVSILYKQVIPSFEVRGGWLISSLNGVEDHLGNILGPQGATGAKGQDGHTPYLSVQEYKPGILALMSDGLFITNEIGEVFPVYCDTLAYPEHVSASNWFNESKPHNTLVKWCGEDTLTLDTGEIFDPGHVYRHVKAGNVVKALTLYGKRLDTEYPSEWVEFPVEEVNLLKLKWELLSIPYTYDPAKLIFSPMGSYVEVNMEDNTIDILYSAPLFNEVFTENLDVNSFVDQNRTSGWMVGYKEFICENDMWVLEEYNNEVPEAYKTLNLAYRMQKDSNESLENPTEL